jgi:glycosyltransferase involved in cell wall biosynthesis
MDNQPLVSVILPVYNAERFLRMAIESILNQSYRNIELIIVNDCSKDESLNIANEYGKHDSRVIVKSNFVNLKLAKTLNRAISLSNGKYLARMDADDISAPTRIEKQVRAMEENQNIAVVGCDIAIIDENDRAIGFRKYLEFDKEIKKKLFFFSPFCHPAIMIRRKAIDSAGVYDHLYNPAEDYELYFRLGAVGNFMNLKEVLFTYRIVENSMTLGSTRNMEDKTIEIREKYRVDYNMPLLARIYNLVHKISLRLVSPVIRVKVFNFIRQHFLS